MAEIDDQIRAIAALGAQRDRAFTPPATPLATTVRSVGMTYPIGAKVLDLVTGLEGTVIDGKRENVIIPAA